MAKDKNNKEIDETEAADTLHAGSQSPETTKLDALNSMMSMMQMTPKDDWLKMVSSFQSEWEANKSKMPDNSGKNKDSIKTTLENITLDAVRESAKELFAETDLSDEGKEKLALLFEAAVNARLNAKIVEITEDLEKKFEEEIEAVTEDLMIKLDTYLDVVTENWVKENAVAIESTLRAEAVVNLVNGINAVFAENNINIPEEDAKVRDAANKKIAELEDQLNATMTEMVELKKLRINDEKNELIAKVAEGLTMTQAEKLATLVESIDFDGDEDTYTKKLEIVKEAHFSKETKKTAKTIEETLVSLGDVITEDNNNKGPNVISDDPNIDSLLKIFNREVDSRRIVK